jgi:Protein of unknown function (DUF1573)
MQNRNAGSWNFRRAYGTGATFPLAPARRCVHTGGIMHRRLLPALLLTTALAHAGLEFEKTEITVPAKADDTQVSAEFKFKVTGDRPVRITDIDPTCSCLKAETKDGRAEYKPGEEGVLHSVFELGAFEGVVGKQIILHTDQPGQAELSLTVKVEIPLIYKAEPETLTWEKDEAPKPKTIKFTIVDEKEIAVTGIVSSRDGMNAEVKEVKKGREYTVTLTPRTTAEPMLGFVRVETDAPYARHKKRLLFFNIKRAAAPGPTLPAPKK